MMRLIIPVTVDLAICNHVPVEVAEFLLPRQRYPWDYAKIRAVGEQIRPSSIPVAIDYFIGGIMIKSVFGLFAPLRWF